MLRRFFNWINSSILKSKKDCKKCLHLHYLPTTGYYCGHYKECKRDVSKLKKVKCDSFKNRGAKFWLRDGGEF